MISGYTSNKLDLLKTYSQTNPYQLGVNGVTNITYLDPLNPALSGITSISYTIDDINYTTTYINTGNVLTSFPTTFNTNLSSETPTNYFFIKEESKMGMAAQPKITNELFIDRTTTAVFEIHSRLSEIKTLEALVDYRNGYYNIVQNY